MSLEMGRCWSVQETGANKLGFLSRVGELDKNMDWKT